MIATIRDRLCPPQHREDIRISSENARQSLAALAEARALRAVGSMYSAYVDAEVKANDFRHDFEREMGVRREDQE